MIDSRTIKKLEQFVSKLEEEDYRILDATINFVGNFIHFDFCTTIGQYTCQVLRIKDFVNEHAYCQEQIVDAIKERILNLIECEYRAILYEVLNGNTKL